MKDLQLRARNALLGLAIGDALGWPAMFHRSRSLPAWTRRLRREIDAQREESGVLRVPMPFSLNQPAEAFDLHPTDDAEWACWTMENLLRHDCAVDKDWVILHWRDLAQSSTPVLGGISTQAALDNLRRGLLPPATGSDNPHYFDDGAMCRSVPIGIAYAGSPTLASSAAEEDASVTNSEDGIWVARATAAAVAVACGAEPAPSVIDAAMEQLPTGSWSRRVAENALSATRGAASPLALLPALHEILNKEYSDGCVGPESLALSLGIVSAMSDRFGEAITTAVSLAKGADAVPSIVGAIVGALTSENAVPVEWETNLGSLKGVCLPSCAGKNYVRIVDEFVKCATTKLQKGTR